MHSTTVKKSLLFLSLFLLVSLACDISVTVNAPTSPAPLPTNTLMPATRVPTEIPASATPAPSTLAPNPTATPLQPSLEGVEVTVDLLRMVLSPQVASGARGLQFPRVEGNDVAQWELTPGHVQLKLEGYPLQDRFHEPQIDVYPAQAYAEMVPAAFESMHRLNNILYDPGAPIPNDQLPLVPFFNAAQVFASNIQVISFQNGRGVRFLTEYAQFAASANNHELFYHFQGLTADGAYFIVAILPISAPVLAETSDAGAVLPPGGVPYPYFANPGADMEAYYASVIDVLNATPPESFTPTISQLDVLIQSMRINQ
jgi:hypothetical protein